MPVVKMDGWHGAERPAVSARERSAMTTGVACVAVSSVVMALGALFTLLMAANGRDRDYCETGDHPGPCTSWVSILVPGLTIITLGIIGVLAGVGLRRGRPWARYAVSVVLATWIALALAFFVWAGFLASNADPSVAIVLIPVIWLSFNGIRHAARAGAPPHGS